MSTSPTSPQPTLRDELSLLLRGLTIQKRVIGALVIREMYLRHGRNNVGFLWIVLEPMTFAIGVTLLHAGSSSHVSLPGGMDVAPFTLVGYTAFILFRSLFSRGEGSIWANRMLFYHRIIKIQDVMWAKFILDTISLLLTLALLLSVAILMGYAKLPVRVGLLIMGFLGVGLLAFSLSQVVAALTHVSKVAGKFIHPITYFMLPLSGAFFTLQWLPEGARNIMKWSPLVQLFELMRYGMFESATDKYIDPWYITLCIASTFVLGSFAVKVAERHSGDH